MRDDDSYGEDTIQRNNKLVTRNREEIYLWLPHTIHFLLILLRVLFKELKICRKHDKLQ